MTTAPIDLARRRFEVGVDPRFASARPTGGLALAVDVDVVVGEEYEAITVEGSWKPAESWEGARPAPPALDARATSDGGVIVTLTPTEADASGLSDAQADMQPRGRGSLRCIVPPRFCGVDVTTGGGHCHVAQVVRSAVAVGIIRRRRRVRVDTGANLRVNTAGGDVRADTITADAVIGTDGGSVRVGKLVGRTLEVNTYGGRFRRGRLIRWRPPRRHRRRRRARGQADAGERHGRRAQRRRGRHRRGDGGRRRRGGAIAVDTAGGKLVAELRESLRCAFDAYTGGGDATVTVPEGFAISP